MMQTNMTDMPGYQERSVRVKFLQQLFLGVGGATVFGIVGALALGGAALSLTTGLFGIVGVGSIYLGSKFLAESVRLDQENQARKIGLATQQGPVIAAPEPEQAKTITTTPLALANAQETPTTTVSSMLGQGKLLDSGQMLAANSR